MLYLADKHIQKKLRQPILVFDYRSFNVGVAGFEPTTPCSQSRCANRTALHPDAFFKKWYKGILFFE